MKKILLLVLLAVVIISCKNNKKEKSPAVATIVKTDSLLITDSSWGAITNSTDLAGLLLIYGSDNIKDEWICGPECADTILVTKVFPGQTHEITVYWQDSAFHKKIEFMECFRDGTPYHTVSGLKNGSTLNDLLKVNGQKITFSGFGWDYGGFIQSYHNGTLERSPINFRLDFMGSTSDSLIGDIELHTDMPVVKKALDSIYLYYLSLSFRKE